MFRKYGIIGILLILFVELNYFLKIEPLANWYFPFVWTGYILIVDALVYKLRGNSLISNRFLEFLGMAVLSIGVWWIFEVINIVVQNWQYTATSSMSEASRLLMKNLAFATVIPAVMETAELFRALHLFDHTKLKKTHHLPKRALHLIIGFGIAALILPFLLPAFTYPLIWLSFFLILDPINYIHRQPSILKHLEDRRLSIPLTLMLAGIVCGFFWEFWNFWAVRKWTYTIPFLDFFKVFEMPLLGYLGYFPFALEVYAMYFFVRSLFLKKEKLLVA